jgi:Tfp pilus assembly protein PilW
MVKMLTHMSGTGLDPITLKEAREGDPEAIQSLLQSAAGNERIQELLRIAEETGGAIKVSDATTDSNGNKVPAGVSINGELVTDVRDQNRLIYRHAMSKEGGAAALLERAMNGDTVAAAAVTQNLIDKHHGESSDGFKYLNLAKGLREGGVKGIDVDAVRSKETELDNLLNQAKSGTPLNPEQIQRVQTLCEELEELTKHARNNDDLLSKMEEEEHITAVQATRNIGNGTTSLFDQAKAERSEEEKAAAAAREQQEQETECRTKVTELAKKLLEAFDDNGRLQVETDSW